MNTHQNVFFEQNTTVFTGNASGRMDVMGGIADYSGSRVLQKAIRETTTVQIAFRHDRLFRIATLQNDVITEVIIPLDALLLHHKINLAHARQVFKNQPTWQWASYIVGCFLVIAQARRISLSVGFDIWVESAVPVGKGVSSSAALEVATLKAIGQAYDLHFDGTELPRLAQQTENKVVGAPCGLMDQLASYFGSTSALLPIDCRPDILYPLIQIPENVHFVGIDSGITHAVSGASYGDVRTAAFMGYTLIAQQNGCQVAQLLEAKNSGDWSALPYQGYLAQITPSEFEKRYRRDIPFNMRGDYFLKNFGVTIDSITSVEPQKNYPIRNATIHPIAENFRVKLFEQLLTSLPLLSENAKDAVLTSMGELMYQSHESYAACGLGNTNTDILVEMVQQAGTKNGVYGAKITGGGFGGTVCLLAYGDKGLETAHQIHQKYQEKIGQTVSFFC